MTNAQIKSVPAGFRETPNKQISHRHRQIQIITKTRLIQDVTGKHGVESSI